MDLSTNQITDLGPLAGLGQLGSIKLSNNQVTDLARCRICGS